MKRFVIVATKARAVETTTLLDFLVEQEVRPDAVYIVGTEASDLPDVARHPLREYAPIKALVSKTSGASLQRNLGISELLRDVERAGISERWFVAFFDDDFRPHRSWLRHCGALFAAMPSVAGMTGRILADGIKSKGLSEVEARIYLSGNRAPEPHWASSEIRGEIECVYGCNMAFADRVILSCRFEEALPLYSWQEDQDYTTQAARLGEIMYEPACRGVHLGTKKGRTSGVRFGYSQIANPIFLVKKRTMARKKACVFITKHLLSNTYHSLRGDPIFDYRGRLKGNLMAFIDLVRGISHPRRILDI